MSSRSQPSPTSVPSPVSSTVAALVAALETTTDICAFVLSQGICDADATRIIAEAVMAGEAAIALAQDVQS